jgi:hypothetical protein
MFKKILWGMKKQDKVAEIGTGRAAQDYLEIASN